MEIPEHSRLSQCVAIGYTAKGLETWAGSEKPLSLECVGIPPFPNSKWPRVVGIFKSMSKPKEGARSITYLKGDALEPRGTGKRILAHIINDKTPNWGAGFPIALKRKWPHIQSEFKNWAEADGTNLSLGNCVLFEIDQYISVFNMVAQHGYGPSPTPRIRYAALKSCLEQLAVITTASKASVHMPRIGSGQAGGSWPIIKELIHDSLVTPGVDVTVYDLPNTPFTEHHSEPLHLFL